MREARETFSPEWARASKSGAVEPLVSAGIAGVTQQILLWTSVGLAVGRPAHTHTSSRLAVRRARAHEKKQVYFTSILQFAASSLARREQPAPRAPPTVQVFPQLVSTFPSTLSPCRRVADLIWESRPLRLCPSFFSNTAHSQIARGKLRSSETYIVRTARRAFGSDSLPRCRASKLSGAG